MAIDFSDNIDSLLADLGREARFAKESADLKEQQDNERKKEAPPLPPTVTLTKKEAPALPPTVTLTKKVQLPVVEEVTEVSADELAQSLFHTLANESRRITAEINGALGDLDVEVEDITEEVSVELKKVPVLIDDDEEEVHDITYEEVESLVAQSAKQLATLEDVDYKPSADNEYMQDTGQLAKRIEVMQNTLSQMTSVGWGQAGMTYGSGEVRLEFLDDVNRDSVKSDGKFLQYQASSGKWIGATGTETEFDPAGYEYTNDSSLYLLENASELGNGIFCEEGEWTKLLCDGYTTNNLPTGDHGGIANSEAFTGSGSDTYSRIWNKPLGRFYFDEMDTKTVVVFRVKVDMVPDTNNTLVQARINFFGIRDGTDNPILESSLLYPTDPEVKDRIVLEDDSGVIIGDYFQAYNFKQIVAAQELADGAGVEQERTFVFPIYVGAASAQRGFGEFEILGTADMVVNDTSILGYLN